MRVGLLIWIVTALASATAAHADVIEVAEDGSVKVLSDSATAVWSSGTLEQDADIPSSAVTTVNGRVVTGAYADALHDVARAYNLSPHLLEALVWQESRWNPAAVSSAGAIGLGQLMPGTANELGVDPRDPVQNLAGAARYLRQQLDRFDGDVEKALAAYNAGPGRVMKARGVPRIAETQAYVRAIVGRLASTTIKPGEAK